MPNQYVNKVVYGNTTLIDLTTDTATAADVLDGVYFHLKSGERVEGTCTYDADTSDATAAAGEILSTKTAYVNGVKITGSMTNKGGTGVTVNTPSASGVAIPAGYYDGSGKAKVDSTTTTNCIANNIRSGITILGVQGTMSGSEDVHAQSKTVTPATTSQTVTPDSPTYNYLSQVTVTAIPYTETDNVAGGTTVTIAGS